jgi:hypothetical protein
MTYTRYVSLGSEQAIQLSRQFCAYCQICCKRPMVVNVAFGKLDFSAAFDTVVYAILQVPLKFSTGSDRICLTVLNMFVVVR